MCQTYDVCFIFNLGNKNLGIYCYLSLILCHFWRQNCLKTSILLLWATLVNTCWPYVCDITKWSLGARKYLSQVPSPQISRQEIQNSSRGVDRENHFLSLQWIDGITTFICRFTIVILTCFIYVIYNGKCCVYTKNYVLESEILNKKSSLTPMMMSFQVSGRCSRKRYSTVLVGKTHRK